MTDSERLPDAESARPEDETISTDRVRTEEQRNDVRSTDETGPLTESDHARSASFRSDAGPGSVLRERQPGFGGMDARPAAEGEPSWQAVTSDRYGHRIDPAAEKQQPATPSSGDEAEDSSGEPPPRR